MPGADRVDAWTTLLRKRKGGKGVHFPHVTAHLRSKTLQTTSWSRACIAPGGLGAWGEGRRRSLSRSRRSRCQRGAGGRSSWPAGPPAAPEAAPAAPAPAAPPPPPPAGAAAAPPAAPGASTARPSGAPPTGPAAPSPPSPSPPCPSTHRHPAAGTEAALQGSQADKCDQREHGGPRLVLIN